MITPHKMNFNKNRPGPNRLSVGRRFSWGLIFSPHYFLPLTIRDFGEKLVKVLFHHNHSEAEQTFACIFSNCWERTKEVFDPVIGYTYYWLVNQTWTLLNFWLPFSSKKFDYIAKSKKWSTTTQKAQICTKCTIDCMIVFLRAVQMQASNKSYFGVNLSCVCLLVTIPCTLARPFAWASQYKPTSPKWLRT